MNKVALMIFAFVILFNHSTTACLQTPPGQAGNQPAAGQQLLRVVKGQVLTSNALPAVQLEFNKMFKYAGGQSFILYGVANAEQHFFVDADQDGRVKRLYWVQFEGYLPTNTHTYRYQPNEVIGIGGLSFIADGMVRKIQSGEGRPDSDGAKAQTLLESKGYRLEGSDVMLQRLVHLTDESKRNELMIIYAETLEGTGFTAADLGPNGRAVDRWKELKKGLLERAVKGLKLSR